MYFMVKKMGVAGVYGEIHSLFYIHSVRFSLTV